MKLIHITPTLLLLFAFALCGCKTMNMRNIESIPIPTGVSRTAAINAVLRSADQSYHPERRLPAGPVKSYEDGRWSRIDAGPDYADLSYSIGIHRLTVRYAVGSTEITPTIIDSLNLKQSRRRIHQNAITWINRHKGAIQDALFEAKTRRP